MIADLSWTYLILSRWIHVLCACLVVGGTFFIALLLPGPGATNDDSVYLRGRRAFKRLVHTAFLLLLATGAFNAVNNWERYRQNIPLTHALFGPHLLFGVLALIMLIVVFAKSTPAASERKLLRITFVILVLTLLLASALKYAREHPKSVAPPVVQPVTGV